jgi:hypothetical protein
VHDAWAAWPFVSQISNVSRAPLPFCIFCNIHMSQNLSLRCVLLPAPKVRRRQGPNRNTSRFQHEELFNSFPCVISVSGTTPRPQHTMMDRTQTLLGRPRTTPSQHMPTHTMDRRRAPTTTLSAACPSSTVSGAWFLAATLAHVPASRCLSFLLNVPVPSVFATQLLGTTLAP